MHSRLADDRLTTKLITNEPIKELEDVIEENLAWISPAAQGNTRSRQRRPPACARIHSSAAEVVQESQKLKESSDVLVSQQRDKDRSSHHNQAQPGKPRLTG